MRINWSFWWVFDFVINCGFLSFLIFQNHLELLVPGSWGKSNQRTIRPNYF
jgi:hypothetical protein